MHSFRLFGASCLLLCMVTGALLPPLHALLLSPTLRRNPPGAKHTTTLQAFPAASRPTAAPRAALQTRWDASSVVRRLYRPDAEGLVGTWDEKARQLLGALPVLHASGGIELETVSVRRSPSGIAVRLQQVQDGVPLWGAEAVVAFTHDARPLLVANDLQEPPAADRLQAASVSQQQAESVARQRIGMLGNPLAAPRSTLAWRALPDGWRLAWCVQMVCAQPSGDWQVWVDASTGAVLEIEDRTVHVQRPATATYTAPARVFLPDPVTATGDTDLQDDNDADSAVPQQAYTDVTLRGLDAAKAGVWSLHGEFVRVVDWESPDIVPVTSLAPAFVFERSHSGFEDVMVYYHIDTLQRWYQSLGFDDANNRSQPADAHGFWGEDNSKYLPTLGWLSFGEGGVDDAEDAAVIVHEYGHATQYDIVPSWGIGGHTAAMGEGFGDYLANSYAYSLQPQRVMDWNGVFQWDGHNEFWPGRRVLDPALHYPESAVGPSHVAGTLWCSALTDALYLLGDRALMDQLVLNHHYLLTGNATMEDAANAILLSDLALHDGAHLAALTDVFQRWGMLDAAAAQPVLFTHDAPELAAASQPLPVLELRAAALEPAATPQQVFLHTRDERGTSMRWPMQAAGGGRWLCPLPGAAGTDVFWNYWFESLDAQDVSRLVPPEGGAAPFTFVMGQVAEDFETATGWSVRGAAVPASRGLWERVEPVGTAWQPTRDHTPSGTTCWVTGNAAPGAPASDADVDDGGTVLCSPVWDVSGATVLTLHYWFWFANNGAGGDVWQVRASGDAGSTWTTLEESTQGSPVWRQRTFDLGTLLPGATALQLEFLVEDGGTASLVEAALDDVVLRVTHPTDTPPAIPRSPFVRAHPNPFNPTTTVSFDCTATGHMDLDVYDLRGRHLRRLASGPGFAGPRQIVWDGRDAAGRPLSSGVYLVRLRSAAGVVTRKVTLLR